MTYINYFENRQLDIWFWNLRSKSQKKFVKTLWIKQWLCILFGFASVAKQAAQFS